MNFNWFLTFINQLIAHVQCKINKVLKKIIQTIGSNPKL